ncbi:MAG: IS5/IS1182 family transposase [Chloroflexi bacterium]|nr:IS5/IS1182 family transposase [Chloroflexota bacterium]
MNYHTLSDFRIKHRQALDDLTQVLGRLCHAGLVEFEHIAQDGIRVRASAGAASFHRQATLAKCLTAAQALLASLEEPHAADAEEITAREQAAQERAARERVERLETALAEMPAAQAAKPVAERGEARVSSTDPATRVMKMPDGGFRPAYNVQFATDTAHRVITGVDVTNAGSDPSEMEPMIDQVQERCDHLPADWLMDGSFVSTPAIEAGAAKQVRVLAPVPAPKNPNRDPALALPTNSPALAEWRARMTTPEAKATDRLRAATSECVNAQARSRHGLLQFRVRGLIKAEGVRLCLNVTSSRLFSQTLSKNFLQPVKIYGIFVVAVVVSPGSIIFFLVQRVAGVINRVPIRRRGYRKRYTIIAQFRHRFA